MADNVIRDVFKQHARAPEPNRMAQFFEPARNEQLTQDTQYVLANTEIVRRASARIEEIPQHVLSMTGFAEREAGIEQQRQTFRAVPFGTLCDIALRFGPKDWSTKRTFFGALAREYSSRIQRVINALPKN